MRAENPELQSLLDRISRSYSVMLDLSPVWADFAAYMEGEIDERFSSQKDPWGNDWKILSRRWKARKRKERKFPDKILVYENFLNRQINTDFGELWYEQGTTVPYAAVHQYGNPAKNIPKRPFMDITEENLAVLKEMLLEYVGWEE